MHVPLPHRLPSLTTVHLPAGIDGPARTLLRIEGFSASIDYRLGELSRLLRRFGRPDLLEGEPAGRQWAAVRDVLPFAGGDEAVWRLSTAPGRGRTGW